MNKIILTGNLTRDPEMKYTASGTAIVNFAVAVSSGYGDKKETLFLDVTVFGKTGESCSQYLSKGKKALVEGRLQKQEWEKEGVKHYKYVVIAEKVEFLSPSSSQSSSGQETVHEDSELEPF